MNALHRGLIATLLGVATVALAPSAVHAQIAAAIGKPLPSPDLPAGTVSVRLVAGTVANPVVGADVTLVVNGTPRTARTDAAGRAQFPGLPAGAKVQAKALDEDGKELSSDEFDVGSDTGQRLLLSTKPFQPMGGGGAGGAPFAGGGGGAGGMPDPRQLSGQPRAEATDQPGTYTVRLTYDDLADKTPPVGVPVYLVGYKSDDSLVTYTAASDAAGRATFHDLDRSGATSYFAMAQLPRGDGAARKLDRLVSNVAVLDSRSGVRLILSAEKRDAQAPALDDLGRMDKQDGAPGPGRLLVELEGVPESAPKIELVALRAGGGQRLVASVVAARAAPNPQDIHAQSTFEPQADMPAHALRVEVHGGGMDDNKPVGGVSVRLVPASAVTPTADLSHLGTEQKTPDTGFFDLTESTKEPLIAVITVNGKEMQSQPFDLNKGGGVLDVEAHWDTTGKLQAMFDTADVKPDEVLVAQSTMFSNKLFRSLPFQPVADHGTRASILVYPRTMFTFSWTSHIDDEFLAVGGKFQITNNSWAPYVANSDGLIIPLPAGYKGARVGEQDQDDVAVAQGEGFRLGRPIPPGGRTFHAQFSMPIEGGDVAWSLDLPLGAFQSGMEILQSPGMVVDLPASVRGQTMTVPQGTFFVLPQISIAPHQSMHMTIRNLPSQAAWHKWAPRLVGLVGLMTMLGGLALALYRTSSTRANDASRALKRTQLLDELVELEKSGTKNDKRRTQITNELEQLWVD